jgi:hypothetical protein
MNAVIAGITISVISFLINRKVVTGSASDMKVWNGWVAAIIMRFIGVAASGVYLAVLRSSGGSFESATVFMVTVLGIVLLGIVGDVVFSLVRAGKMRKAGF